VTPERRPSRIARLAALGWVVLAVAACYAAQVLYFSQAYAGLGGP